MKDLKILRELASRLAEIAALPVQKETKRLWKANNMLRPERPMVIIDQIPWHEMDVDGELTLHCEDDWNREIERSMRQTLYKWKHMRCDMVVEDYALIPAAITGYGYGLSPQEVLLQYDEGNTGAPARHFEDVLKSREDLEKIRAGTLRLDEAAQTAIDEKWHSIYDGILPLVPGGVEISFQLWDFIVQLHTVEHSLLDLIDRPDFIHAALRRFTEASLSLIDQLENLGKLQERQQYIHCTGAYWDWEDAPAAPGKTSAKNAWTFGMSQIFSTVSPAMHEEFELPYLTPLFARFGNVYYGCCEPLHTKIDMIRKYPNVRKISMSPWADIEIGSAAIGKDYVVSDKPNPAFLARTNLDEEEIRSDLARTMRVCASNGSPLEFILKDLSTVRYQPQRLWKWADIAMDLVQK